MNKIFITAEIGINHNGNINIAKKLIDMAYKCDCDAVKFQKRTLEKVIPKNMWYTKKETPWGTINYIDYKKKLEFGTNEFNDIDRYCKNLTIDWYASAWDLESQIFLDKYNLKYNKIASTMLTHDDLVEYVSKQGKKTFISTAFSTWEDIDKVVDTFRSEKCPFILMHCVGLYPCPDNMLNLNMINTLKERYNCEVGYSGHSPGVLDTSIAVTLGAKYIEKHITLDTSMWGSDQSASLERKGLEYVTRDSRLIDTILGDGKRHLSNRELEISKKLRYWE